MNWWLGFILGIAGGATVAAAAGRRRARTAPTSMDSWLDDEGGSNSTLRGQVSGARRYGGLLEDERLTREARERIAERGIDALRVDVTTVDGVMYLRGRPHTAHDAAEILRVAETTEGIEQVVNELKPLDAEEKESAAVKS